MKIVILGYLGSVGESLQKVLPKFRDKLDIKLISLDLDKEKNKAFLEGEDFNTLFYVPTDFEYYEASFPNKSFISGEENLKKYLLKFKGLVINLLPGLIGYNSLINSIHHKNIIITSHKEGFVFDGDNLTKLIKKNKVKIIPVDSEIYALRYLVNNKANIKNYLITASGGALRDIDSSTEITKELILKHPTWQMAPEITINSATMVNKVFEIVEAHHYFNIPLDKIKVLINYESNVHAGIITNDQRLIFNLSINQMAHPIELALNELFEINVTRDYEFMPLSLNFNEVDLNKYPLYKLGLEIIDNKDKLLVYFMVNRYLNKLFYNEEINYQSFINGVINITNKFNYALLENNELNKKIEIINIEIKKMLEAR